MRIRAFLSHKREDQSEVAALREALKGSDIAAITAGATALAETLNRVSTAAYQASASEAEANGANGSDGSDGAPGDGSPEGEPAGAAAGGGSDETVEGEFKEV